ncbi:hypothetical protein C4D60_Mb05t15890 [Musa balbisiana]|uniref:Uncharacterized protein n=1 Tax=Musa balbisiana TaxID=52838 RepID=A0A4S8JWF8_MUSBA|nr:hypothetical protein C4D60_Mb05t15890 [Musa balbisiana]
MDVVEVEVEWGGGGRGRRREGRRGMRQRRRMRRWEMGEGEEYGRVKEEDFVEHVLLENNGSSSYCFGWESEYRFR